MALANPGPACTCQPSFPDPFCADARDSDFTFTEGNEGWKQLPADAADSRRRELTKRLLGAPASCRQVYDSGYRYAGKMPALRLFSAQSVKSAGDFLNFVFFVGFCKDYPFIFSICVYPSRIAGSVVEMVSIGRFRAAGAGRPATARRVCGRNYGPVSAVERAGRHGRAGPHRR
jgi:hypothetical protein